MPAWILSLLSNLPAVIGIVQGVETAFASSPTGASKTGAQKLAAATSLITTVLPAVTGTLASTPADATHTEKVVGAVVSLLNSTNSWAQQQAASAA